MIRDSRKRSLVKTFSWRFLATGATILLVWSITGQVQDAFTVGFIEVFLKMLLYFFHERLWVHISFGRRHVKPYVLWFTGLSGAGKTTIAKRLIEEISKRNLRVEWLDGDVTRGYLPATGFSREARDAHVKQAGFMAYMLEKNNIFVVASYISPYRETREEVRSWCNQFVEIYISTPLEACEDRDVKGLYAKVRKGEIKNFTGIDDPYEPPPNPELAIDTSKCTIDEAVHQILAYLKL